MSRFAGLIKQLYPCYIANKAVVTSNKIPVKDKYTGQIACHVSEATAKDIKTAISHGKKAERSMKDMASFQKKEVLLQVAQKLKEREPELAAALCVEVGKPIKDAKVEINRAIDTFTLAAEEATRISGEYGAMDISLRNKSISGITSRFPVGLISMIVPFNFPINLAAHKVAPAIAAGCPFVLKPSERTPLSAVLLGDILASTPLPEGAFSILPTALENAHHFSEDNDIKFVSFTGSAEVGWKIKAAAAKKKVSLELGGNAACIVDNEYSDLDYAADRIAFGAFYQSGQSCISVQRVLIHDSHFDKIKEKLIDRASKLKKGDPQDENTFLGPLISENDAKRIEGWVNESGGKVLIGGKRDGAFYDATVVENPNKSTAFYTKEAFAPVCSIERFSDFKQACEIVNDSLYGLQAGLFTNNIHKSFYAFKHLDVGGVVINDVPSVRVDSQPYGGIKESGFGREGVRYAIEDFTEPKVMLMKGMGESL